MHTISAMALPRRNLATPHRGEVSSEFLMPNSRPLAQWTLARRSSHNTIPKDVEVGRGCPKTGEDYSEFLICKGNPSARPHGEARMFVAKNAAFGGATGCGDSKKRKSGMEAEELVCCRWAQVDKAEELSYLALYNPNPIYETKKFQQWLGMIQPSSYATIQCSFHRDSTTQTLIPHYAFHRSGWSCNMKLSNGRLL